VSRARRSALVPTLLAAALSACGGEEDACASIAGTCLALRVASSTVDEIDQLELDILYGDRHATATTRPDGGGVVPLPLTTAIELDLPDPGPLSVGVVAAGKLSGRVLGAGAASATLGAGDDGSVDIQLAPIEECTAGGLYCGGDKLAGDPDTLYQCNAGGVPLARGVCAFGCTVRPADDDTCRGGGGPCVEGGLYCGGDKLDGDPQTLYRCAGGLGVDGVVCPDGCIVSPEGTDDLCR
jgi:hypothetical protein